MGRSMKILMLPTFWLTLTILSLLGAPSAHAEGEIIIIAHPSVSAKTLAAPDVQRIFLLKDTAWKNGAPIIPVNREAASSERLAFSSIVLGVSVRSLSNYWNRMQFKGYMPPVVQESDAAMIAFVQNVPGAVGYITTKDVPDGVIILARIH